MKEAKVFLNFWRWNISPSSKDNEDFWSDRWLSLLIDLKQKLMIDPTSPAAAAAGDSLQNTFFIRFNRGKKLRFARSTII